MLADARSYDLVVTAEDGIAEGGVGAAIVSRARPDGDATSRLPVTITLGTPLAFLPHGKPADLLANLGLDGPGIAATVLEGARRRQLSVAEHRTGVSSTRITRLLTPV